MAFNWKGAGKGAAGGAAGGAVAGAAIGTLIFPGIGTAIGAAVGVGVGWISGTPIGGVLGAKSAKKEEKKKIQRAIAGHQAEVSRQNAVAAVRSFDFGTQAIAGEIRAQVAKAEGMVKGGPAAIARLEEPERGEVDLAHERVVERAMDIRRQLSEIETVRLTGSETADQAQAAYGRAAELREQVSELGVAAGELLANAQAFGKLVTAAFAQQRARKEAEANVAGLRGMSGGCGCGTGMAGCGCGKTGMGGLGACCSSCAKGGPCSGGKPHMHGLRGQEDFEVHGRQLYAQTTKPGKTVVSRNVGQVAPARRIDLTRAIEELEFLARDPRVQPRVLAQRIWQARSALTGSGSWGWGSSSYDDHASLLARLEAVERLVGVGGTSPKLAAGFSGLGDWPGSTHPPLDKLAAAIQVALCRPQAFCCPGLRVPRPMPAPVVAAAPPPPPALAPLPPPVAHKHVPTTMWRPGKSYYGPGSTGALPHDQAFATDDAGHKWVVIRDPKTGAYVRDADMSEIPPWARGEVKLSGLGYMPPIGQAMNAIRAARRGLRSRGRVA